MVGVVVRLVTWESRAESPWSGYQPGHAWEYRGGLDLPLWHPESAFLPAEEKKRFTSLLVCACVRLEVGQRLSVHWMGRVSDRDDRA